MSDDQKRILESSIWAITNLLRGKMNSDDYFNWNWLLSLKCTT
jgi:hypothetical protein